MNKLIPTLLICLSAVFATGVFGAAQVERSASFFERAVQCHWLTASNEDTQGDQSETPPDEEEEPDCD